MPRIRLISHNGETHNLTEWAQKLGLKRLTLLSRLRRGLSLEEAMKPAVAEIPLPDANTIRDVPGVAGYAVTCDGRVWSHPKTYTAGTGGIYGHAGRWMTLTIDKSQACYPHVRIHRRKVYVHRLVALAWIPNPDNYREVNHINGVKADARVENLEWCTPAHNKRHARATGLNPNRTPARTAHCRRMRAKQIAMKETAAGNSQQSEEIA